MLTVEPIPAFSDNYIWLITHPDHSKSWVVDPGDANPVLERLQDNGLSLEGVLLTHHHPDHDGGITALKQTFPDLRVVSGEQANSTHTTEFLAAGASIEVLGCTFELIEVPGHTLDHVAFFATAHHPPLLFCGDTLFAAGCGRVFEGTPPQMYASLQKLSALPAQTRCYCAHEYTEANLRFAVAVEPKNPQLLARIDEASKLRAQDIPTVPSTLELEHQTNPFLRCHTDAVGRAADQHASRSHADASEVFTTIRGWKDAF